MNDQFTAHLRRFLLAFEATRHLTPAPTEYESLPFGQSGHPDPNWCNEWRWREYDLQVLTTLLAGKRALKILDVGAWNGWLSHRLTRLGHALTAIDYFDHPRDGLGARQFYSTATQWRAIQMDLRDLSVLGETFDVIILNRCLAFIPNPVVYVRHCAQWLRPGGQLILTGLQFYRDPRRKAEQVAAENAAYYAQTGQERFLFPTKGYLDGGDRSALRQMGVRLKHYPQLWRARLRAWLWANAPVWMYGVYSSTG